MNLSAIKQLLLTVCLAVFYASCFASSADFNNNNNSENCNGDAFQCYHSGPGSFNQDFNNNVASGFLKDPLKIGRYRRISSIVESESGHLIVGGAQCRTVSCQELQSYIAKIDKYGNLDESFAEDGVYAFNLYEKLFPGAVAPANPADDYVLDIKLHHDGFEEKIVFLAKIKEEIGLGGAHYFAVGILNENGTPFVGFDGSNIGNSPDPGFETLSGIANAVICNSEQGSLEISPNGNIFVLCTQDSTVPPWNSNALITKFDFDGDREFENKTLGYDPSVIVGGYNLRPSSYSDFKIYYDSNADSTYLYLLRSFGEYAPAPFNGPVAWRSVLIRFDEVYVAACGVPCMPSTAGDQIVVNDPAGPTYHTRPWAGMKITEDEIQVITDQSLIASGYGIFSQNTSATVHIINNNPVLTHDQSASTFQMTYETGNPFFPIAPISTYAMGGISDHDEQDSYIVSGMTNHNQLYFIRMNEDHSLDSSFGYQDSAYSSMQIPYGTLSFDPNSWDQNWFSYRSKPFFKTIVSSEGDIYFAADAATIGINYTLFGKLNGK